jgi:response regulator NasT
MLVCPVVDATVQALLGRINPLAILVDPQSVHHVAACLEVALATHRRVLALGRELAQLRDQLQDRMLVERAKRVLMEARGLTEGQAMADLQAYSRRGNHKLVTVARKILAAYRVFNGLHEGEPNPGDEEQG